MKCLFFSWCTQSDLVTEPTFSVQSFCLVQETDGLVILLKNCKSKCKLLVYRYLLSNPLLIRRPVVGDWSFHIHVVVFLQGKNLFSTDNHHRKQIAGVTCISVMDLHLIWGGEIKLINSK